jgi:hypothetical protein
VNRLKTPMQLASTKWLATAYAVSLGTLVTLALWMFFDTSFPWIVASLPGIFEGQCEGLYPRIVALTIIAGIAIVSTGFIWLRLAVVGTQGRSLVSLFAAITSTALWIGVIASQQRLTWAGTIWHARQLIPGLKTDVAVLAKSWPTQDGELPYLGPFWVGRGNSEYLIVSRWEHMRHTHLRGGPVVRKELGRLILFYAGRDLCESEYIVYQIPGAAVPPFNQGGYPAPFGEGWTAFELEPNWYLVWREQPPIPPASARTCRWDSRRALFVP